MAKIYEREQALKLRKHGSSIPSIATKLGTSKSTVSYWCRDIVLTPAQKQKLIASQKHAGRKVFLQNAERRRLFRLTTAEQARRLGALDVRSVSKRDLHMIGLALYWGEGYKSGNDECGFTNSNPDIIQIYIAWLKRIYTIPLSQLTLRVSINELHANRDSAVRAYWSRLTGIPLSQFTKTSFIKTTAKKVYANPSAHYGTLRVKVARGTQLRHRIMGSLRQIADQH